MFEPLSQDQFDVCWRAFDKQFASYLAQENEHVKQQLAQLRQENQQLRVALEKKNKKLRSRPVGNGGGGEKQRDAKKNDDEITLLKAQVTSLSEKRDHDARVIEELMRQVEQLECDNVAQLKLFQHQMSGYEAIMQLLDKEWDGKTDIKTFVRSRLK